MKIDRNRNNVITDIFHDLPGNYVHFFSNFIETQFPGFSK